MYLIMSISLNTPDYDHLFDCKETAIMWLQKYGGQQGIDYAKAWTKDNDELWGEYDGELWDEYYKKYRHSNQIVVIHIDPINDLITQETIFDMAI